MIEHGAAHSNSICWEDLTTELNEHGIHWDNDTLTAAIREALQILRTEDEQVGQPLTADPVVAEIVQPEPDVVDVVPVSQRPDYDGDEWYTPVEYIEAARAVMGAIDLDPASCALAQTVIKAGAYLDRGDNGLGQRWICERIWLNPPYSDPAAWITKLVAEFDDKTFVRQAVVLVNNATETAWFQMLLNRFPACFPSRRIAFWRHDHEGITARQGQTVFYLGTNIAQFAKTFGEFGPVLRRMA
ncbi:MAG: hypothetical protein IPM06_19930 [Rhizobiales bacterium]|nr:hypothetical protein [Hyphomicrobiales bacterium]